MSRTDKDRPYWVRVRDQHEATLERHWHAVGWRRQPAGHEPACDLAHFDTAAGGRFVLWTFTCDRYIPNWASGGRWWSHAPGDWVKKTWHGPERTRERAALKEAVYLFNAGGLESLDDYDFENRQARHCAQWAWA